LENLDDSLDISMVWESIRVAKFQQEFRLWVKRA
jgi:hypothetical protein